MKRKFIKFIVAIIMLVMLMTLIGNNSVNADILNLEKKSKYEFASIILSYAAHAGQDINTKEIFTRTEINNEMISSKEAVEILKDFNDNDLRANDASALMNLKSALFNEIKDNSTMTSIKSEISQALGIEANSVNIKLTFILPEVKELNIKEKELSFNSSSVTKEQKDNIIKEICNYNKKVTPYIIENHTDIATTYQMKFLTEEEVKEKDLSDSYEQYLVENENVDATTLKVQAVLKDGTIYTMVLGNSGEYKDNWYMVKTYKPEPKPEFDTELSYKALVDGKNVGGTNSNGTFLPSYDKDKVEKDADVTATIKSTTNSNIVKVNNVALTEDGKPNSEGWYYVDVNDKTVIAKDYPFDKYDNITANGIVSEPNVKLTSSDGLTDTQNVSIKWPFRIIKVTQDPEKIDESTDKVRVEITTNLPIDKEKLPEGWKFTTDEEGKTQHRVYREFEKGENYDKDVILTANNRNDTDSTKVTIKWPSKDNSIYPGDHATTGSTFIFGAIAIVIATIAAIKFRKLGK